MSETTPATPRTAPAILAALAALFVGVGLARFAYTPLLPAVVAAGWFGPDQAAYLGAANLGGYLLGAIAGRYLTHASRAAPLLMLVTGVTFVACAAPLPFWWFVLWRFVSGVTGGALMVIAAPAALRVVPPARRGLAGGLIFAGVGIGIAGSGFLVPQLLKIGLGAAWATIGGIAVAVTLATWRGWPADIATSRDEAAAATTGRPWPLSATVLIVVYGVVAAGLVPHMVFLVDFIARGLGAGITAGSGWWVVFGASATVGPAIFGALADRVGFGNALACALTLQIGAIGVLLISSGPLALAVTSVVVGAYVPASGPLVLGRLREIFHDPVRQQIAWSRATIVFSLGQAGSAWLLSVVFAHTGDHRVLFGIGTGAFALALLLDRAAAVIEARQRRSG